MFRSENNRLIFAFDHCPTELCALETGAARRFKKRVCDEDLPCVALLLNLCSDVDDVAVELLGLVEHGADVNSGVHRQRRLVRQVAHAHDGAERGIAPFLFTGVQILHPRLFAGETPGKWSLNRVYDKALAAERLYGLRHDGAWYHVGDPAGRTAVETRLKLEGAAAA